MMTPDPTSPISTTTATAAATDAAAMEMDSQTFHAAGAPEPNESEVEELAEFLRLIDGLPRQYQADFYRALSRLVDGFERRQRILGYIQESLGQMGLDLKYLVFDLDATRRERDKYKRQLEFFTQNE